MVEGSSRVRGSFFTEFIWLQYNSGIDASKIYFRETSIEWEVKKYVSQIQLLHGFYHRKILNQVPAMDRAKISMWWEINTGVS